MLVAQDRRREATPNAQADRKVALRDFPPATSSVTEARHWARDVARDWGLKPDVVERLAFSATELAANAVMHARSPFRVTLDYDGRRLRLEVEDASSELPRELHAGPEATGGRGVAMVRAMSSRTGVRRKRPRRGKRVWAEMDA